MDDNRRAVAGQVGRRKFAKLLLPAMSAQMSPNRPVLMRFGPDSAQLTALAASMRCGESEKDFLLPT